jgi:hypothetical protein
MTPKGLYALTRFGSEFGSCFTIGWLNTIQG